MQEDKNTPNVFSPDKKDNQITDEIRVKEAPEAVRANKHNKNPIKWYKGLTKKQKIIVNVVVSLIVFSVAGAIWYFFLRSAPAPAQEPVPVVKQEAPAKTTVPSRLTGLEVDPSINQRTVTGIMIENSPSARPQSGLKDAGVVYEAVVEGGITRFIGLFQDTEPTYVGPVRSVRPYYLDFLGPYDAGIAHVGGSGTALTQIRTQGIKDLDQSSNPGPYWRETSRYAPHNMYTDVTKLKELEAQKGWKASDYKALIRGADSKAADVTTAKTINIVMSSTLYDVSYTYDKATNSYLRSEGGKPHVDAKTNTQLAPNIVVVPIISRSQDGIYSVYATTSGGKVLVFQNGTVTIGTWSKASRNDQFTFANTDGSPLKLAAGQTWITAAASEANVTYAP